MTKLEIDLWQALNRLRTNEPTHVKNRELLSKGKLKINVTTVTREAGRSRTLLSTQTDRFEELRLAITDAEKLRPREGGLKHKAPNAEVVLKRQLALAVHYNAEIQLELSRLRAKLARLTSREAKRRARLLILHENRPLGAIQAPQTDEVPKGQERSRGGRQPKDGQRSL